MSDTTQSKVYSSASTSDQYPVSEPSRATGWVGLIVFAGVMLALLGTFHVIEGIVALVRDNYYVVTNGGLVFSFDYTAWGWIHIILGAIAVLTGIGLLMGQGWARWVGIAIAGLSAVGNMAFLPAFPVWSALLVAIDVLIIYALAVHGREMRA
jgi:hypothetical protein